MKSDYLPIDDGASDLAWRFRNSANVPDIELSVAIRAYGDQCRRAGAEAAADLAWRAMNDGVSLQGACDLIRALPSAAEAASPAAGWRPIADAPEGIKLIAGYHNDLGKWCSIMACYYLPGTLDANQWSLDAGTDDDGFAPEGWYEESDSENLTACEKPPTHWMPLPVAPIAAPSEEARAKDK